VNKTESVHVQTLLNWILGQPAPDGRTLTLDDARYVATELAGRANTALMAGPSAAQVDNLFDELQPTPVPQPAHVVLLNPSEVRLHFADQECPGTASGDTCPPEQLDLNCARCRLDRLTDEQLRWAATTTTRRDNPLDEGLAALWDAIVALAAHDLANTEQADHV
jgi:hypothetical protein